MQKLLTLLIAGLLFTTPAWATTYYVATTGSDSNNGTAVGTPFLTIQKGVNSATAAGDIVTVANGTYAPINGTCNYVVYITNQSACGLTNTAGSGTEGNPITLKATNRGGAKIQLGIVNSQTNTGVYLQRPYWVIDGFEILGVNASNAAYNQTAVVLSANNSVVRYNTIHDIAKNTCYNSSNGNVGVSSVVGQAFGTVDRNVFYDIGRRANGENGCSSTFVNPQNRNDHGIYIDDMDDLTITNNVFYTTSYGWRGFAIQIYTGSVGTSSRVNIYQNTFAGQGLNLEPQITLSKNYDAVNIKNNLSYNSYNGLVRCSNTGTTMNATVSYNIGDKPTQDTSCNPVSGTTFSNNIQNSVTLNLTNPAAFDFTLLSTSAAINAGLSTVCTAYNGSSCDMGAYETFAFTGGSCVGQTCDVQMNMNLNTPLIPGTTGFSLDASRTITGVALVGSSVARLTYTGTCTGGNVSYDDATGTATDSALIGGTLNQRLWDTGPIALTNNCGGAAYTFTQTVGAIYSGLGAQTTTAQIFGVSAGGMVAVRTKFKATVADPPSITTKLRYSVTGEAGTYADVPDTFGAGNIRYVGLSTYAGMDLHGTTVSTERLTSEFSGMVSGGVVRCITGCEVPAVDLTQNSESEQVDLVEFDTDAAIDTIYWFRRVQSDGTVMTYAANSTPSVTIKAPSSSGFASLSDQPTGLSVTPNPTRSWRPSPGWLVDAR